MSPMTIAWVVFACVFGGALLGLYLRGALPEHHLSADTKDVVKVAIALIATMGALVLRLLISSAKSSFDTRSSEIVQMSADIVLLDRVLARYGPETKDARDLLRRSLVTGIERIWHTHGAQPVGFDPTASSSPVEALYDKLEELSPQSEAQRSLQAQRFRLLIFWLTIIFASFGLFAPNNATVAATFLVCALSVSGAIFLILELDQPFGGMIEVSSAPLRHALARLGQ